MKTFASILMVAFCLVPAILLAQTAREQIELTREVIQAEKKLLVSTNMQLTEQEAQGFWPVYEEYQKALRKLNDRRVTLIEDYAEHYDSLSDTKAKSLLNGLIVYNEDKAKLQKTYLPKFEEVLLAWKLARYYQIENKLDAVINYELAKGIPLVR